jgi:hypothetical protein
MIYLPVEEPTSRDDLSLSHHYDWKEYYSGVELNYLLTLEKEIKEALSFIENRVGYPVRCGAAVYENLVDLTVNRYLVYQRDEIQEGYSQLIKDVGFIEGYLIGIVSSVNMKFKSFLKACSKLNNSELTFCEEELQVRAREAHYIGEVQIEFGNNFSFKDLPVQGKNRSIKNCHIKALKLTMAQIDPKKYVDLVKYSIKKEMRTYRKFNISKESQEKMLKGLTKTTCYDIV